MPRPLSIPIEDHKNLRKRSWYPLRVASFKKNRTPPGLQVVLEHVDESQAGRKHVIVFPLPLRPAGPIAEFLQACGFDLVVGTKVETQEAVGTVVLATFAKTNDGHWEVTEWKRAPKGRNHDA